MRSWLIIGCAMAPAAVAQADLITVDFHVNPTVGASLVDGTFTFDESLDGDVLAFTDLTSFDITVRGVNYDLDYVLTGGPFLSYQFEFDTSVDAFIPGTGGGFFPSLLSAATIISGFQIGDSTDPRVYEYSSVANATPSPYASFEISRVPEPATLALLAAGVVCAAPRRRRPAA